MDGKEITMVGKIIVWVAVAFIVIDTVMVLLGISDWLTNGIPNIDVF